MSSVQVLDQGLKSPHTPPSSLNLNGSPFANPKVVHDCLSASFESEPLLDADHNFFKFLSMLHQVVSPAFPKDVRHDHLLDFCARIVSFLGYLATDASSDLGLQLGCMSRFDFVQSCLESIPSLLLDKDLCHATFPALFFTYGQNCLVFSCIEDGSFLEDHCDNLLVNILVDSASNDGPEFVCKVLILDSVAIAHISDSDGFKNTSCPKLSLD